MVTLTPAIIARERSIGDFPDVKAGVLVTNVAPYSPADRRERSSGPRCAHHLTLVQVQGCSLAM